MRKCKRRDENYGQGPPKKKKKKKAQQLSAVGSEIDGKN
jgi:hypothetical protein